MFRAVLVGCFGQGRTQYAVICAFQRVVDYPFNAFCLGGGSLITKPQAALSKETDTSLYAPGVPPECYFENALSMNRKVSNTVRCCRIHLRYE